MNGIDDAEVGALVLSLLDSRAAGATLCPSEVARALAKEDGEWRMAMPRVHAAVDRLLHKELIRLSWKGERLESRSGPYRIASRRGVLAEE